MPTALFRQLCIKERVDPYWLLVGPEAEPVTLGNRRLETDLLEQIIRFIETWAVGHPGSRLSADRKAKVIRLAYEYCVHPGVLDAAHINELLTLIA